MSMDVRQLRQENESLRAEIAKRASEVAKRDATIHDLRRELDVYRRLLFGAKRAAPARSDGRQGHLFEAELLAEAEQVARGTEAVGAIESGAADEGASPAPAPTGGKGKSRGKSKARRRSIFPDHAPVLRTTYELPEGKRGCACGAEMTPIGESVTKELERLEVTVVHEIARTKYACRACGECAKTAPGPPRVIDKGLLGPGFLAHVIVDRFLNHMPYYRQEQKYDREGLSLSRTVLERSAAACAALFRPIYDQLRKEVLASEVLFTDDTSVKKGRPDRSGTNLARVWFTGDKVGNHLYDVTDSRRRDGPIEILGDHRGYLHADAFSGYDRLYLPGGATECACWAHFRRKIEEALAEEPELCRQALDRIAALYDVERDATERELNDEQRLALRHERSKPLLEQFASWLEIAAMDALPKGKFATAVRYGLNQWAAFCAFLKDGRIELDNNRSERGLRPFAVGRKNWLFFMTPGGGQNAAILMSLVMTAKAAGLNPYVYLRDLLIRISFEPDASKLTPFAWKRHFAEEVERDYRGSIKVVFDQAANDGEAPADAAE